MSVRNMTGAVPVEPTVQELQISYNRANAKVARLLLELQAAESDRRGAAARLNNALTKGNPA